MATAISPCARTYSRSASKRKDFPRPALPSLGRACGMYLSDMKGLILALHDVHGGLTSNCPMLAEEARLSIILWIVLLRVEDRPVLRVCQVRKVADSPAVAECLSWTGEVVIELRRRVRRNASSCSVCAMSSVSRNMYWEAGD